MSRNFRRPLSLALGALATTALGGCYYGDVGGGNYASSAYSCETRYGSGYYDSYDPYAYDDGYGYDCYDGADYGRGFVQIGFGGGWYDDYYYPGYGMWMFDSYRNRYPLRGQYLNYWGGRRAWWMHRQDRPGGGGKQNWKDRNNPPVTANPVPPGRTPGAVRPRPPVTGGVTPTRPGSGDGNRRPGGWNRGDRDGTAGTPLGRSPDASAAMPPTTGNPRGPGMIRPRPSEAGEARPERGESARPGGGMGARPPAADRPAREAGMMRPAAPSPRTMPASPPQRPAATQPDRGGKRDFRTRDQ